ncbi:hypothetical protein [Streptomyces sp. NPDC059649]|uniref:hypothetical protein n=1 Tax=Streptomyces sp. NPDC059649 TaxID=3346895 RepID=UPI0036C2188D
MPADLSRTMCQFTARGFRLSTTTTITTTVTVAEDNFPLLPYYGSMGWNTLHPRRGLGLLDPAAGPSALPIRPRVSPLIHERPTLRSSAVTGRGLQLAGCVLADPHSPRRGFLDFARLHDGDHLWCAA